MNVNLILLIIVAAPFIGLMAYGLSKWVGGLSYPSPPPVITPKDIRK